MRLDQYTTTVTTNGIVGKKMTIQNNAKAFSMIIDKLYTDIKYAIVRELMTNAYDSHKEHGNPERPMLIHVPSKYDRTIKFRDYGISMTHETVETVFSTLMSSTKDDKDDAVGGWGIGSKTPLGYTNQLSFTAFLNGKARLYHIYIDGEGIPNILLVSELDSEEEQGIEISFEVLMEDITAFRENIKEASKWFDVLPETTAQLGFEPGPNQFTQVVGTVYDIGKRTHSYNHGDAELMVRQGCVGYPLDIEKLTPNDLTTESDINKAKAVYRDLRINGVTRFIDVPIGTADVTASRDALYYNEKTCSNLVQAFLSIYDELHDKMEAEFAKVTTYYEACCLLRDMSGLLLTADFGASNMIQNFFRTKKFGERNLTTSISLKNTTQDEKGMRVSAYENVTFSVAIASSAVKARIPFKPKLTGYSDIKLDKDSTFIIDSIDPVTQRFAMYRAVKMAKLHNEANAGHQFVWIQVSSDKLDGLKKFLSDVGNPPVEYLADVELEKEEKEKVQYAKRNVYRYFYPLEGKTSERVVEWDEMEKILISDKFMYVKCYRTELASEYKMSFDQLYQLSKSFYKGDPYVPVIMVTKTTEAIFKKYLKGKFDYHAQLMTGAEQAFDVAEYALLKNTIDREIRTLELEFCRQFDSCISDRANLKYFSNTEIIETYNLYEDYQDLRQKKISAERKLDLLNLYLDEEAKERIRVKIELNMKAIKPKIAASELAAKDKQLQRQFPWMMAMSGAKHHSSHLPALLKVLDNLMKPGNGLALLPQSLEVAA